MPPCTVLLGLFSESITWGIKQDLPYLWLLVQFSFFQCWYSWWWCHECSILHLLFQFQKVMWIIVVAWRTDNHISYICIPKKKNCFDSCSTCLVRFMGTETFTGIKMWGPSIHVYMWTQKHSSLQYNTTKTETRHTSKMVTNNRTRGQCVQISNPSVLTFPPVCNCTSRTRNFKQSSFKYWTLESDFLKSFAWETKGELPHPRLLVPIIILPAYSVVLWL